MVIVGEDELKADIKAFLATISLRDNRGRSNFQQALSKLLQQTISHDNGEVQCLNDFIKYGMNL